MYALVSFFDFFLLVFALLGVVMILEFFASGESKSKLGPPDGVLDPVLVEGDCRGDSLTGEGTTSVGEVMRAFS